MIYYRRYNGCHLIYIEYKKNEYFHNYFIPIVMIKKNHYRKNCPDIYHIYMLMIMNHFINGAHLNTRINGKVSFTCKFQSIKLISVSVWYLISLITKWVFFNIFLKKKYYNVLVWMLISYHIFFFFLIFFFFNKKEKCIDWL